MFDSLTKNLLHFRWISICFMIAKNVCLCYICILFHAYSLRMHSLLCMYFFFHFILFGAKDTFYCPSFTSIHDSILCIQTLFSYIWRFILYFSVYFFFGTQESERDIQKLFVHNHGEWVSENKVRRRKMNFYFYKYFDRD
jgi:hypothetical protein